MNKETNSPKDFNYADYSMEQMTEWLGLAQKIGGNVSVDIKAYKDQGYTLLSPTIYRDLPMKQSESLDKELVRMKKEKVSDPTVFFVEKTIFIKDMGLTPGFFKLSIDAEGIVKNL